MNTSKHLKSVFPGAVVLLTIVVLAVFISMFSAPVNVSAEERIVVADGSQETPLQPAATFPANAGTLGAIPDGTVAGCNNYGTSTPKNVTFTVSGISGVITDVRLSTTFSPAHTWRGDLSLELIAPGGAPSKIIFRQTGSTTATGCGSSSDAAGPYVFFDTASPVTSWWLNASTPTTAGDYKASTPGGVVGGGADTNITPTFAGLGAAANGTWTLRILDGGQGDTGTISAASLTITTGVGQTQHVGDYNGDGKTDFSVGRAQSGNIVWYIYDGVTAPPGGVTYATFGSAATDFFTPEDFDGDNKTDIAVWRPGSGGIASFYVLQSSNNTVRYEQFGQTGDDPAIVGDYDGDGKADPAVFRCPPIGSPDGQCYFYYRGSFNNPSGGFRSIPWGFGVQFDFFPNVGDFDGDGKNDFCIQRSNPASPTQGQFVLLRSSDNGVEYVDWGLNTDFIIPGDYDGDGKSDFCVRRTISGSRYHFVKTRTGSIITQQWGITGDTSVPGDYDGDGKTDIAVWRSSTTPGQTAFYVLNSGTGTFRSLQWGQSSDVPTASWSVH